MRPLLPQNCRLGSYRGTKREDRARLGGLGMNWKSVFADFFFTL